MEALRPGVDAVMLSLLDDSLAPTDFHTSSRDGCRLNKESRGRFYEAWASARLNWPIALQAPVADTTTNPATAEPISLRQYAGRAVSYLRQAINATEENE